MTRGPGKNYTPATFPKLAPRPASPDSAAARAAAHRRSSEDSEPRMGEFEPPPVLAGPTLEQRMMEAISHLDGFPCPGCKDAVATLKLVISTSVLNRI
jgi:hypothetical protein